jgi:hypothetical protein
MEHQHTPACAQRSGLLEAAALALGIEALQDTALGAWQPHQLTHLQSVRQHLKVGPWQPCSAGTPYCLAVTLPQAGCRNIKQGNHDAGRDI